MLAKSSVFDLQAEDKIDIQNKLFPDSKPARICEIPVQPNI
jgi:hypothetical protein